MRYSSNLPIFKLDIFLHKAFGILRRYTACFPPPQAAAMNDWSESTYRGLVRISILSFFLSLLSLSFFLSFCVSSCYERAIGSGESRKSARRALRSIRFRSWSSSATKICREHTRAGRRADPSGVLDAEPPFL